jgi:sugar-specific transcriptional regulator TrmB
MNNDNSNQKLERLNKKQTLSKIDKESVSILKTLGISPNQFVKLALQAGLAQDHFNLSTKIQESTKQLLDATKGMMIQSGDVTVNAKKITKQIQELPEDITSALSETNAVMHNVLSAVQVLAKNIVNQIAESKKSNDYNEQMLIAMSEIIKLQKNNQEIMYSEFGNSEKTEQRNTNNKTNKGNGGKYAAK